MFQCLGELYGQPRDDRCAMMYQKFLCKIQYDIKLSDMCRINVHFRVVVVVRGEVCVVVLCVCVWGGGGCVGCGGGGCVGCVGGGGGGGGGGIGNGRGCDLCDKGC